MHAVAVDVEAPVLPADENELHLHDTLPANGGADAAQEPAFKGYVDGLSHQWRVVGWVCPLVIDIERLQVQLIEGEAVLDSATADMFRGDLLGASIGDGQHGFSLKIPARLFDGQRHTLRVDVCGAPGEAAVGTLDVALPNRTPQKALDAAPATAADLLHSVLAHRRTNEADPAAREADLIRTLEIIAKTYDHATALGCLYVHVLRRRIDADGLQTRLTRLSAAPHEMATVVREVLASDEAKTLYKPGSAHRFPDIAALEVWTRLRRFT